MIARLTSPTIETFYEEIVSQSLPAIVEGVMRGWRCNQWSDDYLASVFKEREFQVNKTASGKFGIYSREPRDGETTVLCTFRELLQSVAENKDTVHYMEQVPINEAGSGLLDEIDYVKWLDASQVEFVNLWYSQHRSRIPLHWDSRDNVLAQVRGTKSVRLYDPSQAPFLYPGLEDADWASQVDLDNPDLKDFPLFVNAQPTAELEIRAGEVLYIPRRWWHYIITQTDISLSINYWYRS